MIKIQEQLYIASISHGSGDRIGLRATGTVSQCAIDPRVDLTLTWNKDKKPEERDITVARGAPAMERPGDTREETSKRVGFTSRKDNEKKTRAAKAFLLADAIIIN